MYRLRIRSEHANNRGDALGGVLMTVPDLVLGYTTAFASHPPLPLTTARLNIDFGGGAQVGDWLEGRAEIVRTGRSLAFALLPHRRGAPYRPSEQRAGRRCRTAGGAYRALSPERQSCGGPWASEPGDPLAAPGHVAASLMSRR